MSGPRFNTEGLFGPSTFKGLSGDAAEDTKKKAHKIALAIMRVYRDDMKKVAETSSDAECMMAGKETAENLMKAVMDTTKDFTHLECQQFLAYACIEKIAPTITVAILKTMVMGRDVGEMLDAMVANMEKEVGE